MKRITLSALHIGAMTTVDYLGGTVDVPSHHDWVAITRVLDNTDEIKYLLVSYADKPELRNGVYCAVGESYIIGEVSADTHVGSLRQVQNQDSKTAILNNTEEFLIKAQNILEADIPVEEKVHSLWCPSRGLVRELMEHQVGWLQAEFKPRICVPSQ